MAEASPAPPSGEEVMVDVQQQADALKNEANKLFEGMLLFVLISLSVHLLLFSPS